MKRKYDILMEQLNEATANIADADKSIKHISEMRRRLAAYRDQLEVKLEALTREETK